MNANNHGARWSQEQDSWLWKHIGQMDAKACAERMGRSVGSIRSRLKLLAHQRITLGEITRAGAAERIGTTEATLQEWIDQKERNMNANNHGARWSQEQDSWLWKHIGQMDAKACAERMGRSMGSIRSRLKLLAHQRITLGEITRAGAAERIGTTEATLQEWIDQKAKTTEKAATAAPPGLAIGQQQQPQQTEDPEAIMLNAEQEAIVQDVVYGRRSIFMTGVAGTGKTTTIRAVARALDQAGMSYGITAMTGTAAVLLGGQTLHSFLGIGMGTSAPASLAWSIQKRAPRRARMLQDLQVLIIDEVSMMGAKLLDLVSEYLGILLGKETEPFGGIRLLLSGDLCQLPPIQDAFCFKGQAWERAGMVKHILTHVYRQENDADFLDLLGRARWGMLNEGDIARLQEACHRTFPEGTGIMPTRLYSLRENVDGINRQEFDALVSRHGGPEAITRYRAVFGKEGASKEVVKEAQIWFEKGRHEPVVELCPGAQVMATWNLKKDGVMNGTRGVVVRCNQHSVHVRLMSGLVTEIGYQTISPADNPKMEVQFLPLQLAWAISIHKSQGMTLDCMEVDLGRSIFEYGQAYTALSRARSLESVRLLAFHPSVFRTHPSVLAFYDKSEGV